MDKINFNDEEIFEKFKDFFDEEDIDQKEAEKLYKSLTEDEKEEFDQYLEDEQLEDDEEENIHKIKNSLVAKKRSDIIRLSDLTNEQIVEQFQEGNQNALGALVDKNQGLVRSRASYFYRSHGNDLELEDLVQ